MDRNPLKQSKSLAEDLSANRPEVCNKFLWSPNRCDDDQDYDDVDDDTLPLLVLQVTSDRVTCIIIVIPCLHVQQHHQQCVAQLVSDDV